MSLGLKRISKAVTLFLFLVAIALVGARLGTPQLAHAQGAACEFQRCSQGRCNGDTNDPNNCDGSRECDLTACFVE